MITHFDMTTGEVVELKADHEWPEAARGSVDKAALDRPVLRLMTVQEAAALEHSRQQKTIPQRLLHRSKSP